MREYGYRLCELERASVFGEDIEFNNFIKMFAKKLRFTKNILIFRLLKSYTHSITWK